MPQEFKWYAALGVLMAILCLVFAGVTFAMATSVPSGYEPICYVGFSGMTPSVELAAIQSGVYKPSAKILYQIGDTKNFPSPESWDVESNAFGFDWLGIVIRR